MLKSGPMLALYSAIFLGVSIPILELAAKSIGPIQLISYSSITSGVILFLLSKFFNMDVQINKILSGYKKELIEIIVSRALIGGILIVTGFSMTQAIKGSFLVQMEPLFVVLIGFILFRNNISIKQGFLLLLIIVGGFLLSTGGDVSAFSTTQTGDILIITALIFTAYSYFPIKRIENKINPLSVLMLTNLIAGVLIFIGGYIYGINMFTLTSENVIYFLGYTLLFYVFMLYTYYNALKKTKAWVVSSILLLGSIVGTGISYFFLGQTLELIQIIGGIVILGSTFFIVYDGIGKKRV